MGPLPCPFCGSSNLELKYKTNQGHGDRTFEDLRVVCLDCPATQGAGNWGDPGYREKEAAWDAWNKRVE